MTSKDVGLVVVGADLVGLVMLTDTHTWADGDQLPTVKQNPEYSYKKCSFKKYSFNRVKNIQYNYSFQKMKTIIKNSKIRPKYGYGALLRPLYR